MNLRNRNSVVVWIVSVLAMVTLVCGLTGWLLVMGAEGQTIRLGDAIYSTLLSFGGDASLLAPKNVWIDVSRFSGLLTTISALLAVLANLIGARFFRMVAGWRSEHVVVVGASDFAVSYARPDKAVSAVGKVTMTVIDRIEVLDLLDATALPRTTILIDDAMSEGSWIGRSLGRTPKAMVFGSADSLVNVTRARAWMRSVPPDRRRRTSLTLRIEDKSVGRELELLSSDLDCAQLISRSEMVARSLVTAMAPIELAYLRGQSNVHVALVGLGSVNLAIAEEIAMRCHHPDLGAPRLTIVDRDRVAAEARVRAERPDLCNPDFGARGLSIKFLAMDALECCEHSQAEKLEHLERELPLTAIIIAAGDDARNAGIAMRMRQLQTERLILRAPAFMHNGSLEKIAPIPPDDLTAGLIPFGGHILAGEDLELEEIREGLAAELHNIWRRAPSVEKTDENAWENLPASNRRSSYRAAMSIVEMLYAAGFVPPVDSRLAGLRVFPQSVHSTLGNDDLIRSLTANEHRRWNDERRLEGYRAAPDGRRDNEKKRHPLIVPFADLPPEEAEKDERIVRGILHHAVERYEAKPDLPCWRKVFRVGLIGPLNANADDLRPGIDAALDGLLAKDRQIGHSTLEILSPNAPGFDRVAACLLAEAWYRRVGRPCRVLLFEAGRPQLLDRMSLAAFANKPTATTPDAKKKAQEAYNRQSQNIAALRMVGHRVRVMDLRPVGCSDAELAADPARFMEGVKAAQQNILRLADELMVDTADDTAVWTLEAVEAWQSRGNQAIRVT